jgi:hypothetical protein
VVLLSLLLEEKGEEMEVLLKGEILGKVALMKGTRGEGETEGKGKGERYPGEATQAGLVRCGGIQEVLGAGM